MLYYFSRKGIVMDKMKNLYGTIAGNVRAERKQHGISQEQLAEQAEVSVDTIKSIESGRRAMSLDTYIRIVQALDVPPLALLGRRNQTEYIERFAFMVGRRSEGEIEFALHMVEQLFKGQDCYLKE